MVLKIENIYSWTIWKIVQNLWISETNDVVLPNRIITLYKVLYSFPWISSIMSINIESLQKMFGTFFWQTTLKIKKKLEKRCMCYPIEWINWIFHQLHQSCPLEFYSLITWRKKRKSSYKIRINTWWSDTRN